MAIVREFCGYLFGLAFAAVAVVLCGLAWMGLDDAFGWRWALGGIVMSLLVRINFPVLVGLFCYARNILGWGEIDSVVFALPGLLIATPAIASAVFGLFVATAARR